MKLKFPLPTERNLARIFSNPLILDCRKKIIKICSHSSVIVYATYIYIYTNTNHNIPFNLWLIQWQHLIYILKDQYTNINIPVYWYGNKLYLNNYFKTKIETDALWYFSTPLLLCFFVQSRGIIVSFLCSDLNVSACESSNYQFNWN